MRHRLQELRWRRGWSEGQLEQASGVSRSTICRMENKKDVNPTIDIAFKLADALEVDVRELFFTGEDSQPKKRGQ